MTTTTSYRRLATLAGLLLIPALGLTACGGITGPNGEKINVGTGGVSISASDGSVQFGENVQVPAGYPADVVPLPAGFKTLAAIATKDNGKDAYSLTLQADGDKTADMKAFVEGLKSMGFTEQEGMGGDMTASDATGSMHILTSDAWTVTAITSTSEGKTVVELVVAPVSPTSSPS